MHDILGVLWLEEGLWLTLVKAVAKSQDWLQLLFSLRTVSLRGRDDLFHLCENLIRRLCRIQLVNQVQLLKVPYDGHCCLLIGDKSFAQALFIVISSATACCPSAQASGSTDLLSAMEKEHPSQVHLVTHSLSPTRQVVFIPGESIDQELILVALFHRPLNQTASDGHRHDGPIGNVVFYQLSILGARGGPLSSQQVSSRKMNVPIFLNYPGTLGSFASSWPSQYKHNIGLSVTHPGTASTQTPPHYSNTCT